MSNESNPSIFTEPGNIALMRRTVAELEILNENAALPVGVLFNLVQILELMITNPTTFEQFSAVNAKWIGSSFIGQLKDYLESESGKRTSMIPSIFTSAYRFLCELEFSQPLDPSFEVRRIINFVHNNLDSFEGSDRQQLIFASYAMPAQVTKQLISHPSVVEFRNFSETIEKSRQLKAEWEKSIAEKISLANGLEKKISNLTTEYNFVGLVHGFQALAKKKMQEKRFSFISLILLAVLMVAPPISHLLFVSFNIDVVEKHRATLIYTLPAILAIEVLLVYLFRVVLAQFRSVKAQILQIELRISLCQFVESFADYASRVRAKDSTALAKFEALIFSGLAIDEANIPSTFDGVEQIAALLKSVRSSAS